MTKSTINKSNKTKNKNVKRTSLLLPTLRQNNNNNLNNRTKRQNSKQDIITQNKNNFSLRNKRNNYQKDLYTSQIHRPLRKLNLFEEQIIPEKKPRKKRTIKPKEQKVLKTIAPKFIDLKEEFKTPLNPIIEPNKENLNLKKQHKSDLDLKPKQEENNVIRYQYIPVIEKQEVLSRDLVKNPLENSLPTINSNFSNTSLLVKLEDSGYTRKFPEPIKYYNKPIPKDLMVMNGLKHKSFFDTFKESSSKFSKKVKNLFSKEKEQVTFNFDDYIQKAPSEFVFNKQRKVVAQIDDIYLTFANPANPAEKNLVLRGPSLKAYEGCIHAIIGESGSGKSVITSLLYGLTGSNSIIESGSVKLYGLEVQNFSAKQWEKSRLRGRIVSAVFQNPMSILDPTMKVGEQIIEGMLINKIVKNKKEARLEAIKYLEMTKILNPEKVMNLYPHELSGGMIQRIALAAIVSLKPKLLIMDEPTTALDPTVQALVLDIIRELQDTFKIATIFITHDLGVVASIADYINIMYAGQIVESGSKEEILMNPQHPYTWGLIVSMPDFNSNQRLEVIRGAVPSNLNNIKGDAFAIRNDYALSRDFQEEPDFYQISQTHFVKSALLDKKAPTYQPPLIIKNLWDKYEKELKTLYHDDIYVTESEYKYYFRKAQEHNAKIKNIGEKHE